MTNRFVRSAALGLVLTGAAQLHASLVNPTSYDMFNGNGTASGGSYDYWDDSYSGAGSTTTDHSFLSGGLGDLTDGVIATDNWFIAEAPAGAGPYVGWVSYDPAITFHFSGAPTISGINLYLDDANGFGGVSAPSSVDVRVDGSAVVNFLVPEPPGSAPFVYSIPLNLNVNSTVELTLHRKNGWVFMSEVEFTRSGSNVPDSGSMAVLLGLTAAGMGFIRQRRS